MATQPPTRPWFRLPSIARPAPTTTPTPEPAPPQPRPPIARPAFRPMTQPQEPSAPAPTQADVVSSPVPSSPNRRTSVPPSPVKESTTTSSLPPSPKLKESPPAARSVSPSRERRPFSPSLEPKPSSTFLVPTSPVATTSVMRKSPEKPVATSPVMRTSPEKHMVTTTSSTLRSPPFRAPSVTTTSNIIPVTTRVPSPSPVPTTSTRTIKAADQTTPESPKRKPTAPPPSPLILPPPLLKSKSELEPKIPVVAEQKAVLVQETTETRKPWVNGAESQKNFHENHRNGIAHHGKHDEPKDVETKKKLINRKKVSSDTEEGGLKVVTIAGENKGAFMEVIRSPMKQGSFEGNSHTLDKKNESDRTGWLHHKSSSSSSSDEGNSKAKKDKNQKGKATNSLPMDAFMNSNVQGVNNSILFHSSCTHGDPGVHLSLSRKPFAKRFETKDHGVNGRHS